MNRYFIEFLGTMFLMFVVLATENWIAIGAAVAICILLASPISVAAFNPAVVISLYAAGKIPKSDVLPYVIVEILGALAAFYVYKKYVNNVQV